MNKFRKDERGSSLVMTIIAATFISLLAVAVISMTVTNETGAEEISDQFL